MSSSDFTESVMQSKQEHTCAHRELNKQQTGDLKQTAELLRCILACQSTCGNFRVAGEWEQLFCRVQTELRRETSTF